MQRLVILGTGGSAHDVRDIVEAINARTPTWEIAGFLDDARPQGIPHHGFEVLGSLGTASRYANSSYFINVIGSDRSYRRRPEILDLTGLSANRFATLVHPAASVSTRARLGRGVCVNFGVSVGGGVVIGNHVTLCPGVIVGHDTHIGDYTIAAPGAVISGHVQVEPNCYIGARAVIRQNLRIGTKALIGMGAVVVRDVTPGDAVIGNPARRMQRGPGHELGIAPAIGENR
jgi:sugar O-acyltransferase (sialic acid O-acetyltransferase NeuD family)